MRPPLLAVLALAAPAMLPAQQFVDTGTFIIVRAGAEAGREEFAIRQTTGSHGEPGFLSVSTTRTPGREAQVAIELSGDYTPVSLQQTETTGGRVARRVSAQLSGIRFSARIMSADGETAREFPARSPLAILSDDAFSGFYFVPRSGSVSVVRARDVRLVSGTVESLGQDTVTVAQRRLPAQRYVLRLADGDERHFWFTASGDLLQVAVPAAALVATRSELPRR